MDGPEENKLCKLFNISQQPPGARDYGALRRQSERNLALLSTDDFCRYYGLECVHALQLEKSEPSEWRVRFRLPDLPPHWC